MSRFEEENGVVTESSTEVKQPKAYRVIIFNDDYTSMEFVVYILENVFLKSPEAAQTLMMKIHETGSGVAGVYSFEVAEMKTATVHELSRLNEYPLRCTMEED